MTKRVELVARLREMAGSSMFDMEAVCSLLEEAAEALAADRAEAGELPELPSIQRVRVSSGSYPMVNDPAGDYVDYDDHVAAMCAYGQQCARAASCGGGEVAFDQPPASGAAVAVVGQFKAASAGVETIPAQLDAVINAVVNNLEMLGAGKDTVTGDPLDLLHMRRIANDSLYMLTRAWNEAITTPPTPSAGAEVPAWVTELVEAAKALKFDVFDVTAPEIVKAFDGKRRIAVVDMTTVPRFKSALTAALEGGK